MWGVYSLEITDIKVHLQHILFQEYIISIHCLHTTPLTQEETIFSPAFYFSITYYFFRNLIDKD